MIEFQSFLFPIVIVLLTSRTQLSIFVIAAVILMLVWIIAFLINGPGAPGWIHQPQDGMLFYLNILALSGIARTLLRRHLSESVVIGIVFLIPILAFLLILTGSDYWFWNVTQSITNGYLGSGTGKLPSIYH